jgi:hypothetical protein
MIRVYHEIVIYQDIEEEKPDLTLKTFDVMNKLKGKYGLTYIKQTVQDFGKELPQDESHVPKQTEEE